MVSRRAVSLFLFLTLAAVQVHGTPVGLPSVRTARKLAGEEKDEENSSEVGESVTLCEEDVELVDLPDEKPDDDENEYTLRGACTDRHWACNYWKGEGFCKDIYVYDNLRVRTHWCPKTCAVCTGSMPPAPPPPPPPPPPSLSGSAWITQLLQYVNGARYEAGLPGLCMNWKLNLAAQKHAEDQANRGVMSHTGGDGSSLATRLGRVNYNWRSAGENVAWNQQDVWTVFKAWMDSPGHKANILYRGFNQMGAGLKVGTKGPYWAQVFGKSTTEPCA